MTVDELIGAIEANTLPPSYVDTYVIATLLGPDRKRWRVMLREAVFPLTGDAYASVTTSLDAAWSLLRAALPGWIYRVAECSVSDDAWVVPDFNDPTHGYRFQEIFPHDCQGDPLAWFDSDVDLRPSGRPAAALCIAMLIAFEKTNQWLAEQAAAAGSVQ